MTLRSLRQDLALVLVSVALSLSLWLYVQSMESLKVSKSVRVQLYPTNKPEDLEVVNLPESIGATLIGNPSEIDKINFENVRPRASIDLSRAEEGINAYRVDLDIPAELVKFEWDYERQVELRIEKKLTSLKPVKVESIGRVPAGTEFQFSVEPERVRVEGARSDVARVAEAIVKLNVSGMRSGESQVLLVEPTDATGARVRNVIANPATVTVVPSLAQLPPERNVLVVPSFRGQPEFGFQVYDIEVLPNQVTLTGDELALRGTKTVSTEPFDLAGIRTDVTRTVVLSIPRGLQTKTARRVSVTVRVRAVPPPTP